MKARKTLLTAMLAGLLSSCSAVEDFWGSADCEDEQRGAISRYGQPEDVETYSGSGNSSETYWWWSKGRSETFNWGDSYDNCERSVYTFTPF